MLSEGVQLQCFPLTLPVFINNLNLVSSQWWKRRLFTAKIVQNDSSSYLSNIRFVKKINIKDILKKKKHWGIRRSKKEKKSLDEQGHSRMPRENKKEIF